MTTLGLLRSASTYNTKITPTTKRGNNPTTLCVKSDAAYQRDSFVKFAIPSIVFAPDTVISSAVMEWENYELWPGSHTLTLAMCSEAWSPTTLSWANQPGIRPGAVSVTKIGAVAKTTWAFNVLAHLASMQAGNKNYGWRLRGNSPVLHRLANTGAGAPHLTITYYVQPRQPNAGSPADGQVVSVPSPVLRLAQSALGTDTSVASVEFQVNTTETEVGAWDSGVLPPDDGTQVDLATIPGTPVVLDPGETRYWRGRLTTLSGAVSEWSEWAEFSYEPLGTVEITVPGDPPDDTVTDPSPPIGWVHTDLDQVRYRLWIEDPLKPEGANVLWDSGIVSSTADTDSPDYPVLTETGKTYRARVRAWDAFNRVPSGGMPEFAEDTKDFTFVLSATVDPVTDLAVVDMDPLPFHKLTFQDDEAADGYQMVRDGVAVAVVDAVDIYQGGTSYEWIDYTAAPRTQHQWTVRRIVNGVTSSGNPTTPVTVIEPAGIWLSDPDNETYIPIITVDMQKMNLAEDGATFRVLNATYAVRVRSTLYGWEGVIVGEILMTPLSGDETGQSLRDQFLAIRQLQMPRLILTMADLAIVVNAFDMTIAPTPHVGRNGDYVYACSFGFVEVA